MDVEYKVDYKPVKYSRDTMIEENCVNIEYVHTNCGGGVDSLWKCNFFLFFVKGGKKCYKYNL